MICVNCNTDSYGKFCSNCGKPMFISSSLASESPSFEDFLETKKKERASHFRPGKKKVKCIDKREKDQATIHVALMHTNRQGDLKIDRGTKLPVVVDVDGGAYETKKTAFEKLQRYNPDVSLMQDIDFKLVYKSGEVVRYLPGTNIEFTVRKYKKDLGVGYNSITLYMLPYEVEENEKISTEKERYSPEGISESDSEQSTSRSALTRSSAATLTSNTADIWSNSSVSPAAGLCLKSNFNGSSSSISEAVPSIDSNLSCSSMRLSTSKGNFTNMVSRTQTGANSIPAISFNTFDSSTRLSRSRGNVTEQSSSTPEAPLNRSSSNPPDSLKRLASLSSNFIIEHSTNYENTENHDGTLQHRIDGVYKRRICHECHEIYIGEECHCLNFTAKDIATEPEVEDTRLPFIDLPTLPSSLSTQLDSSSQQQILDAIATAEDMEVIVSKECVVHRVVIKEELLEIFKDNDIFNYALKFLVIDPRGVPENGEGDGVTRDVICVFFDEFMNGHSMGFKEKVPAIRHDMQTTEWMAVARILLYGLRFDYFPIAFSKAFLISSIFGEDALTPDILIQSFKNYIPTEELKIIESMQQEFSEESEGFMELLDVLGGYGCTRKPSQDSLEGIINEVAHQELVQRPRYISNAFNLIIKPSSLPSQMRDATTFLQYLKSKEPSNRKVVQCFETAELEENEKIVFGFLKKFVKNLDERDLRNFLIFTTGSNTLPNNIQVIFSNQIPRAPRARTCGFLLELSADYSSYADFAGEFSNVLRSPDSFLFTVT